MQLLYETQSVTSFKAENMNCQNNVTNLIHFHFYNYFILS
jgi:hypothetical protein